MDFANSLTQIKRFSETEKDTLLGLAAIVLLEFLAIKLLADTSPVIKENAETLIILAVIITVLVWLIRRRVQVQETKCTIGLSFIDLLSLDVKEMSSEGKFGIEKELSTFLYASTATQIRKLRADKYIEVVNLPRRIKPNFKNAYTLADNLNLQILVWFETFYEGGKVIIEPHFEFTREPTNKFYHQFKETLKDFRTFEINIKKPLQKDSDLTYLLHDLVYLGLIFHGTELSACHMFKEAHKCFDLCLGNMKKSKLKSPILQAIYSAGQYFEARSYHQWANTLLEEGREKEGFALLKKASTILFDRAKDIRKRKRFSKQEYLENAYLYGISLLIKAKKYAEARKKLQAIQKVIPTKAEYYLFLAETERASNPRRARQHYEKAVRAARGNMLIYEKVAKYFFEINDYHRAIEFFEKRLQVSEKRIFQPDLFEEEDHMLLFKAYLKEGKLFLANKEIHRYLSSHFQNRYLKQRFFDLKQ